MLSTFRGGIKIAEHKELSAAQPIEVYEPQDELVFPLSQHIGAFALPCVKLGERVLVGQIIARAQGKISANVISSVSGSVAKIEPRMIVNGSLINSIIVKNDYQYECIEGFGKTSNLDTITNQMTIDKIADAGIVGLGGAGFPLAVKLQPQNPEKIEYVIINGAECEPYLTNDYRCMLEYPKEIIGGLQLFLRLFPNAKGIIAVEDNKPEAIKLLSGQVKPGMEVRTLKTKYPQGGERSLIYVITKRAINRHKLPSDVGCIVVNIASTIAAYDAVINNIPLVKKVVTITGDAIVQPKNLLVRFGTNYQELAAYCGGFKGELEKLISGGPMMGNALFNTHIPVSKTSSALVCLSKDEVSANQETNCIHCGKCVSVCPMHLIPQMMYNYARHQQPDEFERIHGLECISCGCCTYICPAKRNMTQEFAQIKRRINEQKKKEREKKNG